MSIRVEATHGIIMQSEDPKTAYFGWPTVAKLGDGTVVSGCSGLRCEHVCPWGKSVVAYSRDGGQTYGEMHIVHNDRMDDRDLGVIALGGQSYAITWFSMDDRSYYPTHVPQPYTQEAIDCGKGITKDDYAAMTGSWMKITPDGGETWTRPIRVPVSAPHGFSVLNDGKTLGYLGKRFREDQLGPDGDVNYCVSCDGGYMWEIVGTVPIEKDLDRYHEPHVIQLDDGTLLGVIRYHVPREKGYGLDTCVTRSADGGKTWTEPVRMNVAGSPPHLLKHSSGAIVMVYGYRDPDYGQRAVVSRDGGKTWSEEIILRDDAPNGDLGYPASIELDDGSIYTIYYQVNPGHGKTSLMWTRWKLPELY